MGACFSGTEAYEDENKMSKDEMEYWQKRNERKKNIYQKMKNNEKNKDEKICFIFCFPCIYHYFHH